MTSHQPSNFFQLISGRFISLLFTFTLCLYLVFMPIETYSMEAYVPDSVSDLSMTFSEKFCLSVSEGTEPEIAGEIAAKEMIRGLIFSPVIKELMAVPKKELVSELSTNIFDKCGPSLTISEQQIKDYLLSFADRDRANTSPKPFKPFGLG